jgi:protein SCO1/2
VSVEQPPPAAGGQPTGEEPTGEPTGPQGTTEHPRGGGISLNVVLALVVIVVVAGGVALLTGGKGTPHAALDGKQAVKNADFSGSLLSPPEPEPALSLRNYKGEPVNIDQYRGKAVLVTFLYTNCPDICPIITSNLRIAQNLMGPAKTAKTQVIAVSVDPRGDTPKAVAAFLARHGMTGRMQYLIGNAHELSRVWKAWNVGSEQDAQQPQFVNHTGIVYGVTAGGKVTTAYVSPISPKEIAHDAPLLAAG